MITVKVQPRVQKERWSLYWKESMSTATECLDALDVDIDPQGSVEDLNRRVAEKMGWPPVESLLRLAGFEESWELTVHEGKKCPLDRPLETCGIRAGSRVTVVRKVLYADGWKINPDVEDVDSSDEEDDF